MRKEEDFKLIDHAIEPIPRYGVKRLFDLVQASLDKSASGLAAAKTSLFAPPVEANHQESVEQNVEQDKSVSFSLSPSPEARKPTAGQASSIFKQADSKTTAVPQTSSHSHKKSGPATVQKPILKNQGAISSPTKLQAERTNKKQKYPVKSKNFDSKDTGRILASITMKDSYGLSNQDFFSNLAKEFNLRPN